MSGEELAGRYRLLSRLGNGGVGEVWRAEDLELDRPVAVKLLRRPEGDALSSFERFRREARAAARLSHPNVVATYDAGTTEDGRAFLVMELVRGGDLAQLLRHHGLPPEDEVTGIALQAARGLDAAHAAGIVHRDIKPANLLLSSDGTLKITDFGIARMTGAEQTGALTGPVLVGTVAYVSPEQVRGEPATAASDRYALGCVLYELLAGAAPFTGEPHEVLAAHVDTAPFPLEQVRPDISPGLADLVMELLAKDPAARPASATEAEACLGGRTTEPSPLAGAVPLAGPGADQTQVLELPLGAETVAAPRRRVVPATGRRLAVVGAVAVVALVAALGASRMGADNGTPSAGDTPTAHPSASVKPAEKPTPKPTPKPKPSPKPKATKEPVKPVDPQARQAATLRTLAGLLRADAEGRTGRTLRAAARDFDQAAQALTDGDPDEASDQVRDGYRKLGEAQRHGHWRPTPQEIALLNQLGPLGQNGDGNRDD